MRTFSKNWIRLFGGVRALSDQIESSALRIGEAIRKTRREERCKSIGRTAQRSGRPPMRNPKGRGLFRRGFVKGLARSVRYEPRPFPARAKKYLRRRRFNLVG